MSGEGIPTKVRKQKNPFEPKPNILLKVWSFGFLVVWYVFWFAFKRKAKPLGKQKTFVASKPNILQMFLGVCFLGLIWSFFYWIRGYRKSLNWKWVLFFQHAFNIAILSERCKWNSIWAPNFGLRVPHLQLCMEIVICKCVYLVCILNLSHVRCFSSVFRYTSIFVATKPGFDAYNKCYNIGTRGDGDHM